MQRKHLLINFMFCFSCNIHEIMLINLKIDTNLAEQIEPTYHSRVGRNKMITSRFVDKVEIMTVQYKVKFLKISTYFIIFFLLCLHVSVPQIVRHRISQKRMITNERGATLLHITDNKFTFIHQSSETNEIKLK